jgi:hypothetical protein
MANVAQAFDLDRTDPTDFGRESHVPLNVVHACQLTWDCTSAPYRYKQHPNDSGYQPIAQAIAAIVPF